MEFDHKQLDYLNFSFVKRLKSSKTNISYLFQDLKRGINLRIIVFEKTESEKLIYKVLKELSSKDITENLLYRESVNGFSFLAMKMEGPSLKKMFKYMNFKFSEECIMFIGHQVVNLKVDNADQTSQKKDHFQ